MRHRDKCGVDLSHGAPAAVTAAASAFPKCENQGVLHNDCLTRPLPGTTEQRQPISHEDDSSRAISAVHPGSRAIKRCLDGDDPKAASSFLIVRIPRIGDRPSLFRRRFIDGIRIAIWRARRGGQIDAAITEELWRALVSATVRR